MARLATLVFVMHVVARADAPSVVASDAAALALERRLAEELETSLGVLPEQDFEGGYRGTIHLVPAAPVGPYRVHLERTVAALTGHAAFFSALSKHTTRALAYRWRSLEMRFFRSVGKRTPAAFASGWAISYNVNGTLNGSNEAVRDLLFHELFHLNDADHHDWSSSALSSTYDAIVSKCHTRISCLAPYAPDSLIVHNGTYYSFMPGNGVREYAADLAVRYAREQRQVLQGQRVKAPFKCGPAENAVAWGAVVNEFFAGVDLVPPCR